MDDPDSRDPTDDAPRLGAAWDGEATTFSVISRHARGLDVCLFERPESASSTRREPLRRTSGDRWSVRLEGVGPGALYGYRADGPFSPQEGHVFNPSKLLIDPWARAVTGEPRHDESLWPCHPRGSGLAYDASDSAGAMPKCVVVADEGPGDGASVERPRVPWDETVIYEAHVKGLTRLHPEVRSELRGTYLGLASEPVIHHLNRLGVTAVELMPVFQAAPEAHLLRRGRRNYWGYAPVGFFAPAAEYAVDPLGGQVAEFRRMVRDLHRAGIEVILDVVYNHTAEGGLDGPSYSWKGLDQALFYRLRRAGRHLDLTGCGNTLDVSEPAVLELIVESLRYWVVEMGVDGFRFDLAPVLGRQGASVLGRDGASPPGPFTAGAALFRRLADDAELSGVKLVAEPWDLGPFGYQLGRFPAGWAEWNDRFRDGVRRAWTGSGNGAELVKRLEGSPDLFAERAPLASVNYVAAHDGYTLADVASYERKHNEANLEENRDGHDHEVSRNWGVEGPSDDDEILRLRRRHRRNLLVSLFLARGVPMLGHGDELGRTQGGNNNAYCLDDPTTWVDWEDADEDLIRWVERLAQIRRDHPELRDGREPMEILDPSGRLVAEAPGVTFAARRPGLLLLANAGDAPRRFELPAAAGRQHLRRRLLLDTAGDLPSPGHGELVELADGLEVRAFSQILLADPLP